tara:strand:- start:4031 stop:4843 length:813 start_codon:yes stop_codon:yes gene_type:complete
MISFIVQGPVSKSTQDTVDSILKHYPESQIILASTNGVCGMNNVDDIHLDGHDEEVNVNKQILSSQAVNKARFNISCKVRNDIIFTSDKLLEFIEDELLSEEPTERIQSHKLFNRLVLSSNYFFCNPETSGFYYHPSDWIFLGLTSDLKKLFNIPLQDPKENVYYLKEEVVLPFGDVITGERMKYRPEQYIFITALNEAGFDVSLDYEYQKPEDQLSAYRFIANNFYISDAGESSGFHCSKYPRNVGEHPHLLNNHQCNLLRQAMLEEVK